MERGIFLYGKEHLTVGKALAICAGEIAGDLSAETRAKVVKSQQTVEEIVAKGKAVYGINTGFGPLCTTLISEEKTRLLQENILKSHSVGVGESVPDDISKLMLILKMNSLAQGYSGIAETTLDRIKWHIDNDIIPVVPSQGSVGASGDLAPLSHLFLPLIGLGEVMENGKKYDTLSVLQKHGLAPLELGPKEGLALINGTQFILAYAVKVVDRLHNCLDHADLIGAMMVEALLGSSKPFRPELHELRPFRGNQHVAARMTALLSDSEVMTSHANCSRVQDPYSLRCIPQVHGASRNAWLHLKELVEIELNSVTDNPVILDADLTISGGNFHGQPLAMALDYACLAASEIGNISDRRIYLSLEGTVDNVPKLLMKETGINSGFMIPQYTTAALASENKGLCFPASADSIPTSLGQEDHVSMGSIGGRKAYRVIENVEKILGIELLCAAQALDFHRPLKSSKIIGEMHSLVRKQVTHATVDRVFALDIEKTINIVKEGALLSVVRQEENYSTLKTNHHELFEVY
ncbi:histidine ammonia-lyase [Roseivirga seohaensis subsp. aquiponti]|uniref:Histidine ammonia-lyase n=1 Tax=Roseivirga seohaensis subsp. aquiponti TaxID=1566026 RepID=A0A0L8AKA8_9BACT|nr:histidine ammonia-lyase [Roseivirga seohaensis]KOF02661.1 histidine ammonia-lyase [Roseivirga seohaensis subsp. aquiponti]